MTAGSQSYATHRRWVPIYHFFALPILLANAIWKAVDLTTGPDVGHAMGFLVAVAIAIAAVCGRVFALRAQDRVIRLEMRLRLASLLPADQRARIDALAPAQFVALRFASDAELPGLIASVLKDNIQGQNAIKKMIKQWEPDHLRV